MKQRITPSQLNKLPKISRDRLRDWWFPQYGDQYFVFGQLGGKFLVVKFVKWWSSYRQKESWEIISEDFDFTGDFVRHDRKVAYPLLSIGQMIDFLDHVDIPHPIYEQASPGRDFMDYDLMALPGDKWCNKLWKTVVDVLKLLKDLED